MKRRGFLGFLAGGAVAGPGMAKQAAAATLADLNVAALAGGIAGEDSYYGGSTGAIKSGRSSSGWAKVELAKLLTRTSEQHAHFKRRLRVHTLDPDLASYRSIALHQKIAMQRERNYARNLRDEIDNLQAHILGWFD